MPSFTIHIAVANKYMSNFKNYLATDKDEELYE